MLDKENMDSVNEEENEIVEIPSDWATPKPYHRTVILGDGSVVDGYAARSTILSSDNVWVYPERTDLTYMDIVTLFADPNKTSTISVRMSENETITYVGYTRLGTINNDADNKYTVCLTKPFN